MALRNPNARKSLLMWGLYALLLLATLLVQNVYLGRFSIAGVHLSLLPLLACAVGVCTEAGAGGVFALCAGLLWALSGGSDGSITIVCLTVSGLLSGYLCDAVLHRRLLSAVICSLIGLAICCGGVLLVRVFLSSAGLWSLRLTLRQILLTVPLSPIFYGACTLIRKAGPQHG